MEKDKISDKFIDSLIEDMEYEGSESLRIIKENAEVCKRYKPEYIPSWRPKWPAGVNPTDELNRPGGPQKQSVIPGLPRDFIRREYPVEEQKPMNIQVRGLTEYKKCRVDYDTGELHCTHVNKPKGPKGFGCRQVWCPHFEEMHKKRNLRRALGRRK